MPPDGSHPDLAFVQSIRADLAIGLDPLAGLERIRSFLGDQAPYLNLLIYLRACFGIGIREATDVTTWQGFERCPHPIGDDEVRAILRGPGAGQ